MHVSLRRPARWLYSAEMDTATVVVTILVAALFTFSASIKLLGVAKSLEIRDHLGVRPLQWRLIGVCELAGVAGVLVGLMWAPIGIAAAIGLALLTIGAIAYHVRKSDTVADLAPAVIGVALALTTAVLHTL
jgi:DoxX-like family